ncbi:MAG TPA: transposase [Streptosporangiaceae bacterium]
MKATGWLRGLEVTAGGAGIVSHAGVALLRTLSDRTGLTGGLSRALATRRLVVHDRGQVLADLACAIADGAEVISDFRVMADQGGLFGPVASVPTCWRALSEIAGGSRALARITAAVNAARRQAWAAIAARHGAIPGIEVADKTLEGVTCIRLDATVTFAHSDKELAEPNYKGFGLLTELPELSSQFRERLVAGTVTVPDHGWTRRSSSGYGEPGRPVGWFPSGHGGPVGSVPAG